MKNKILSLMVAGSLASGIAGCERAYNRVQPVSSNDANSPVERANLPKKDITESVLLIPDNEGLYTMYRSFNTIGIIESIGMARYDSNGLKILQETNLRDQNFPTRSGFSIDDAYKPYNTRAVEKIVNDNQVIYLVTDKPVSHDTQP